MKRTAEIGKWCLKNCNWEHAFANIIVLAQRIDLFRLGIIAIGDRLFSLGNLSFAKRTLVGWMSGN
jgi:hypothetical protein